MRPYRLTLRRQIRASAQSAAAVVAAAVEIAARAGQKAEALGQQRVVEAVVFIAIAAVYLDAVATQGFEFGKQVALGGGR